MKSGVHYDPERVQCPAVYKSNARILSDIAAVHTWESEHIDITNAYVQDLSPSPKPIFAR